MLAEDYGNNWQNWMSSEKWMLRAGLICIHGNMGHTRSNRNRLRMLEKAIVNQVSEKFKNGVDRYESATAFVFVEDG